MLGYVRPARSATSVKVTVQRSGVCGSRYAAARPAAIEASRSFTALTVPGAARRWRTPASLPRGGRLAEEVGRAGNGPCGYGDRTRRRVSACPLLLPAALCVNTPCRAGYKVRCRTDSAITIVAAQRSRHPTATDECTRLRAGNTRSHFRARW